MTIAQLGAVNTSALNVPGVLTQIIPPSVSVIAGVPTNLVGAVGSASWGPVNSPVVFGGNSISQFNQIFGAVNARKYDLGTAIQIMMQQGATSFDGVRVTDGTDTASNAALATVTAASVAAPGTGFSGADTVNLTSGTVLTVATTKMVTAPAVNSPGTSGSYVPNDTITLAGGTESTNAVLTVATTGVRAATVNAAGSGGTNGTQVVTGTTGTGTKFQAVVTVSGGAITAVQYISVAGAYTVNPTTLTAEPVTGAGLTGATLGISMGVVSTTVTTAGSYTVNGTAMTQGSTTSATGVGASFTATNANYGVLGVTLTTAGLSGSGAAVPQLTTSGSGINATFNLTLSSTVLTVTSIYTGSNGNNQVFTIAAGSNSTSAAPTWRVISSMPGFTPEIFDNIGGTGAAVWTNIANAINNGQSGLRGPSILLVAAAGSAATTPTAGTFSLSGGTDGASGVTSATEVGTDGTTRSGMYALRNSGCSQAMLADADDSTKWAAQLAYGMSEGTYMQLVAPAGTSIAACVALKQAAGIYNYGAKVCHGDWIYWFDSTNNIQRLVSPQAFFCGTLGNLSPQNSTLNSPMAGIIATQTSAANQVYSNTQLAQLGNVGIDVIANPCPGGAYFGAQFGRNSSTDPTVYGDNYTTMTNFIAKTYNATLGKFVGTLFSPTQAKTVKAACTNFGQTLVTPAAPNQDGMIAAYAVQMPTLTAPGVETINMQFQYLQVVTNIVANIEGGQTVQIASITSTPA